MPFLRRWTELKHLVVFLGREVPPPVVILHSVPIWENLKPQVMPTDADAPSFRHVVCAEADDLEAEGDVSALSLAQPMS